MSCAFRATFAEAVERIDEAAELLAHSALAQALLGPPRNLPSDEADRLRLLLAKYHRV